jgi:hypothetical protein
MACHAPTNGIYHDDSMHMVRHDNAFIQFHMGKMGGNIVPTLFDNTSCIIQPHFSIDNISEQTFPVLRTAGHKIRAYMGIIVSLETYRTTSVSVGVVFHPSVFMG